MRRNNQRSHNYNHRKYQNWNPRIPTRSRNDRFSNLNSQNRRNQFQNQQDTNHYSERLNANNYANFSHSRDSNVVKKFNNNSNDNRSQRSFQPSKGPQIRKRGFLNPNPKRNNRTEQLRTNFQSKTHLIPTLTLNQTSSVQTARESPKREASSNENFLKAEITINGKHLNAVVNPRRRVSIVNRTILKLVDAQSSTINIDLINVPVHVNGKMIEIPCITNYKQNVPIILGREAVTELGFRLTSGSETHSPMEFDEETKSDEVSPTDGEGDELVNRIDAVL